MNIEAIKHQAIEAATSVKAGSATVGVTTFAGIDLKFWNVLPSILSAGATVLGIILTIFMIYSHIRKIKEEGQDRKNKQEKHDLEIELLKKKLES
jgi:hypothetical protein